MSRLRALLLAAAALALCGLTIQSSAVASPTLDDRVYAIAAELMCPVCGGQTVAESNSALAEQMRAIIRQRLQAGEDRAEIVAYFVGQFGEGVLATPRPRGSGLSLWLAPAVVVGIGLVILRRFVRRAGTSGAPTMPTPTPAETEAIRREMRDLD